MFGYVTIYQKDLDKTAMDRYQAYYCGLCRALGQKYRTLAQMTLSYDMTFAAMLLSALYEPPTQFSEGRCAPHPVKSRPRATNEYLDYAADMSIVLAYYNYLDDWQDDHKRRGLQLARRLEPYLDSIRQRWPRQCAAIRDRPFGAPWGIPLWAAETRCRIRRMGRARCGRDRGGKDGWLGGSRRHFGTWRG